VSRPSLPGPLVDAGWLHDHLGDVVLVDTRWYADGRSGRQAYESGHLPGAVHADLDQDLAGQSAAADGRHPLPHPGAFAHTLGRLGIDNDAVVVAYDDASGSVAARLWWMLRQVGVEAAVLDGGIAAWGGALEPGQVTPVPVRFDARPWPAEAIVETAGVDELLGDPGAAVIDVRPAARFRGEPNAIDARPGHVPGSRNVPWAGTVDPETGRLLQPDALREHFAEAGAEDAEVVVAFCGSGVAACHSLLAMEVAGLPSGRLYVGSWSAWSADPERPVATGEEAPA
jgi:thiosulfate/3-mercaptopyruvate sulfurtransferase